MFRDTGDVGTIMSLLTMRDGSINQRGKPETAQFQQHLCHIGAIWSRRSLKQSFNSMTMSLRVYRLHALPSQCHRVNLTTSPKGLFGRLAVTKVWKQDFSFSRSQGLGHDDYDSKRKEAQSWSRRQVWFVWFVRCDQPTFLKNGFISRTKAAKTTRVARDFLLESYWGIGNEECFISLVTVCEVKTSSANKYNIHNTLEPEAWELK